MSTRRMHAVEVLTDISLVRRLQALPSYLHHDPTVVVTSRHASAEVAANRAAATCLR